MAAGRARIVFASLALASLGCGGASLVGARPRVDARVSPDAAADAPTDAPDAAPDAAPDVADASDDAGPPVLAGLSLPDGVAAPRRLLDGRATLTGAGRTSCSHGTPASGDGHRWCAFRLPGATEGSTELWTFDVTAAAGGAPLICDGTHPTCVRLTKTLWASYGNDFVGDTLIYYADAPAGLKPSGTFVGPVFAWRPGWLAPRQLAAHATVCGGTANAPVAVCLDDPRGNVDNPDSVAVRVGFLADVDAFTLPALPTRYTLRNDGSVPWQLAFSPDGQTFAISVPDTEPTANLYAIPTRDVGKGLSPTKVVSNVQPWTLSHDGKKALFFRGPRSDATLVAVDFPSGDHELTLATKIVDFLALGADDADTGILLRVRQAAGGHAFQLLVDRDHPTTVKTIFTNEGFLEGIAVSPDLKFTAWIDPEFVGRSIRNADLATCTLNPGVGSAVPPVGEVTFTDDASALFWSQPRPGAGGARDGYFVAPEKCDEKTLYARGLGFLNVVGARGMVWGDAKDDAARTVTLKYAAAPKTAAAKDVAAAGGWRVAGGVTTPVTMISGATGATSVHVLYRAEASDGREAGVWLFGVGGI
jgi:hypothetical protein